MWDEALAWAESVLGTSIREWEPLSGGVTSTMVALTDASGRETVLRLMDREPWRAHGQDLTRRESTAQRELAPTAVPAPHTIGLDPEGARTGVPAHLMSRLAGRPTWQIGRVEVTAMADMLATIHDVRPHAPFRTYQSWAAEAKRVVPAWTRHPASWERAFAVLDEEPPGYEPTFLHRDFSHRNLLWDGASISGVVDWVETSTGPAWLDASHAATTMSLTYGPDVADRFLRAYAATTGRRADPYWSIMDAVAFLPLPGREPMFGSAAELAGLDAWLHAVVERMSLPRG